MIINPICLLHAPFNNSQEALEGIQSRLAMLPELLESSTAYEQQAMEKLLQRHPSAGLLVRIRGQQWQHHGITDGSMLVLERTATTAINATRVSGKPSRLTLQGTKQASQRQQQGDKSVGGMVSLSGFQAVATFCISPKADYAFAC